MRFQPELVYIGHLYILSKALLPFLARLDLPIYYDEGGAGLSDAGKDHGRRFRFTGDWRSRFAPLNWLKPLVIRLVCAISHGRFRPEWNWPSYLHATFNSRTSRDIAITRGVPMSNSRALHSGIDLARFEFKQRAGMGNPVRIIVPGRLERRKGQSDAVLLLQELVRRGTEAQVVLAGSGWTDGYNTEIEKLAESAGISDRVKILPMLAQNELVAEYHKSDICFFTSYQTIGFSRTPLEAMACGCVVISYGNEGSSEIIRDRENGFIVPPGDIPRTADLIMESCSATRTVQKHHPKCQAGDRE